jgi:hypothetical protein
MMLVYLPCPKIQNVQLFKIIYNYLQVIYNRFYHIPDKKYMMDFIYIPDKKYIVIYRQKIIFLCV